MVKQTVITTQNLGFSGGTIEAVYSRVSAGFSKFSKTSYYLIQPVIEMTNELFTLSANVFFLSCSSAEINTY